MPNVAKIAPDALYVVVSNPVDVLTYVFCKHTGIPEERVIGSGTILDTARLRARISEYYSVSQKNVHAYVLGEHGDTAFVPWSIANISNVPVENYKDYILKPGSYPEFKRDEVEEYVRIYSAKFSCQIYHIISSLTSTGPSRQILLLPYLVLQEQPMQAPKPQPMRSSKLN